MNRKLYSFHLFFLLDGGLKTLCYLACFRVHIWCRYSFCKLPLKELIGFRATAASMKSLFVAFGLGFEVVWQKDKHYLSQSLKCGMPQWQCSTNQLIKNKQLKACQQFITCTPTLLNVLAQGYRSYNGHFQVCMPKAKSQKGYLLTPIPRLEAKKMYTISSCPLQ